ncbi:hypothetical protein QTN25_005072 [Entamoeba marina]
MKSVSDYCEKHRYSSTWSDKLKYSIQSDSIFHSIALTYVYSDSKEPDIKDIGITSFQLSNAKEKELFELGPSPSGGLNKVSVITKTRNYIQKFKNSDMFFIYDGVGNSQETLSDIKRMCNDMLLKYKVNSIENNNYIYSAVNNSKLLQALIQVFLSKKGLIKVFNDNTLKSYTFNELPKSLSKTKFNFIAESYQSGSPISPTDEICMKTVTLESGKYVVKDNVQFSFKVKKLSRNVKKCEDNKIKNKVNDEIYKLLPYSITVILMDFDSITSIFDIGGSGLVIEGEKLINSTFLPFLFKNWPQIAKTIDQDFNNTLNHHPSDPPKSCQLHKTKPDSCPLYRISKLVVVVNYVNSFHSTLSLPSNTQPTTIQQPTGSSNNDSRQKIFQPATPQSSNTQPTRVQPQPTRVQPQPTRIQPQPTNTNNNFGQKMQQPQPTPIQNAQQTFTFKQQRSTPIQPQPTRVQPQTTNTNNNFGQKIQQPQPTRIPPQTTNTNNNFSSKPLQPSNTQPTIQPYIQKQNTQPHTQQRTIEPSQNRIFPQPQIPQPVDNYILPFRNKDYPTQLTRATKFGFSPKYN